MKQEALDQPITWREWTLFLLRCGIIALFSGMIYFTRQASGIQDPASGLLIAAVIGGLANLLLALFLLMPSFARAIPPSIVIGDLLIAAVFIHLAQGNPLLVLGIISVLLLAAMLRLSPIWSIVHASGILITAYLVTLMTGGQPAINQLLSAPVALLIAISLAVIVVISSLTLEQHLESQTKRIEQLTKRENNELANMRQRIKAIYDLSTMIGSSIEYDHVLENAMDVGLLSLNDQNQELYSGVLLFRLDNELRLAASRRFGRADKKQSIRLANGIITKCLEESEPVVGKSVGKDPELQYFPALQYCQSVLVLPLRANYENYGVLLFASDKPNAFNVDQLDMLSAISTQATMALQNAVLYQNLLEEKQRLIEAEEDARKQLARDLHDGPTQSIAAIAMRMSYIYHLIDKNPQQLLEELKKVEDISRKVVTEIRHMLFTLRPLTLENSGLAVALNQLAEKMQDTHGQAVSVQITREVEALLDKQKQGIMFYIVEEAVNNARKHAQASLIRVTMARHDDIIVCKIVDNGQGFNLNAVDSNYDQRGSLGMINMRERTAMINGSLYIDSSEGKGTAITIGIPIHGNKSSTNPQQIPAPPATNAQRTGKFNTKLAHRAAERILTLTNKR